MKTAWYRCSKCGLVTRHRFGLNQSVPIWSVTFCTKTDQRTRWYRLDPKRKDHAKWIREAKKMT